MIKRGVFRNRSPSPQPKPTPKPSLVSSPKLLFCYSHLEVLLLRESPLMGVVDRVGVGEDRGSGEVRPPPSAWDVHLQYNGYNGYISRKKPRTVVIRKREGAPRAHKSSTSSQQRAPREI